MKPRYEHSMVAHNGAAQTHRKNFIFKQRARTFFIPWSEIKQVGSAISQKKAWQFKNQTNTTYFSFIRKENIKSIWEEPKLGERIRILESYSPQVDSFGRWRRKQTSWNFYVKTCLVFQCFISWVTSAMPSLRNSDMLPGTWHFLNTFSTDKWLFPEEYVEFSSVCILNDDQQDAP